MVDTLVLVVYSRESRPGPIYVRRLRSGRHAWQAVCHILCFHLHIEDSYIFHQIFRTVLLRHRD